MATKKLVDPQDIWKLCYSWIKELTHLRSKNVVKYNSLVYELVNEYRGMTYYLEYKCNAKISKSYSVIPKKEFQLLLKRYEEYKKNIQKIIDGGDKYL